jgi:hypothetical protein
MFSGPRMKQMRMPGRGLQPGDRGVQPDHAQAEMIDALVGRGGWRGGGGIGLDDEHVLAANLHVDARFALLRAADDLGAEHLLEPAGGGFRVRAAEMDVVEGVVGHGCVPPVDGARLGHRPDP